MSFLETLEASAWATLLRESLWGYPTLEILHLIGATLTVGSIVLADLRLAGRSLGLPLRGTVEILLPLTWIGFALAALSGVNLFICFATSFATNPLLLWKLGVIAVAGLNAAAFHFGAFRRVAEWDLGESPPAVARAAGIVSIGLWCSVLVMGRWIAYVDS